MTDKHIQQKEGAFFGCVGLVFCFISSLCCMHGICCNRMLQDPKLTGSMKGLDNLLEQRCHTHFCWGPHQTHACLQRVECNFRTVKM